MKRITTLLLSAMLLLSLTACGRKDDHVADENMAGSGNTVTDQNRPEGSADNDADMGSNYETPHIDGAETPAERSGRSMMNRDGRSVADAAKRAGEDMKETVRGESWDGMLRNARVRDTDGKLKDGENALHGRYGVQK